MAADEPIHQLNHELSRHSLGPVIGGFAGSCAEAATLTRS
jgi:hypothetical protein